MSHPLPAVGWLRHNFLPPSETFIHAALSAVTKAGVDVRVLAINRRSEAKFPYEAVTALNDSPMGALETARYWLTGVSRRQRRWARGVGIIHAHMGYTAAHALVGAREAKVPLVVSFYGRDVTLGRSPSRFAPQYLPYALRQQAIFREAARVVVLSEHMKAALVDQGCPREKIRIVRIGIDPERFRVERRERSDGERCQLLMVGREVSKKGFDDGIRAYAAARAKGAPVELSILGTGDSGATKLRRLAGELDVPVTWLDPASSVPDALAHADVMMAPSRTAENGDQEGTPTVICEAAAASLPLIGTRHAGIPDQIEHERTGILVDERDTASMADAVCRLAADPALRARMGEAGREKVVREFSISSHRDGLLEIYRDVAQESPTREEAR